METSPDEAVGREEELARIQGFLEPAEGLPSALGVEDEAWTRCVGVA